MAVFTGGGFFGAALAGITSDMLGRRLTILLGSVIFLLGGALQVAGVTLAYLLAGRTIAGLGVGIFVMIVPLYQAEIAHPDIRGRLTGLQQMMIGYGSLIAGKSCIESSIRSSAADVSQRPPPTAPTRTSGTSTTPNGASRSPFSSSLLAFSGC